MDSQRFIGATARHVDEREHMLRILSDGDGKHRLEDAAGNTVGWIHGRAIGFRGFARECDASDAAAAGARALAQALHQLYGPRGAPVPPMRDLRIVHDGAYEWFADGLSPIARLLRPQRRAYDQSFGIELVLPSYVSEGAAITAAQAVGTAVLPWRESMEHAVP
jgi:hypothetical protein